MDDSHDTRTAAPVQEGGSWTGCIAGVAAGMVGLFAAFALIPVTAIALPVAAVTAIGGIAAGNKAGEKLGLY
jgi:hypothetical protein